MASNNIALVKINLASFKMLGAIVLLLQIYCPIMFFMSIEVSNYLHVLLFMICISAASGALN